MAWERGREEDGMRVRDWSDMGVRTHLDFVASSMLGLGAAEEVLFGEQWVFAIDSTDFDVAEAFEASMFSLVRDLRFCL